MPIGSAPAIRYRLTLMTGAQLQLVRVAASPAVLLLSVVLQRLVPHARLRGSWRVNGSLWLVNSLVVGALCGG